MGMTSFCPSMPDSNWLELALIRHGIAAPRHGGGDHPERALTTQGRIDLVGHEPDLGQLACGLLGLMPGCLQLKKAGLVLLRRSEQRWQLDALLRPGLLLERPD